MGAPTKRTQQRREAAIRALSIGHGYARTAEAIGISIRHFEIWRHEDVGFREECHAARERAIDMVENKLFNDALNGNTIAQLAYLRAFRPEKFHRRQLVTLEGDPNNPLVVQQQGTESGDPEKVHFYMPGNSRDLPDTEDTEPLEIEGKAEPDDTEAA
jgi:hypothetical protein